MLKTLYLTLYNLASSVAWAYVLYLTLTSYLEGLSAGEFFAASGLIVKARSSILDFTSPHCLLFICVSMSKPLPPWRLSTPFFESPGFSSAFLSPLLINVRSPFPPTLIQVVSRLYPVWVIDGLTSGAQNHWSIYLMYGSWALVEIPRYFFYAVNLWTEKVTDLLPSPTYSFAPHWIRFPTLSSGCVTVSSQFSIRLESLASFSNSGLPCLSWSGITLLSGTWAAWLWFSTFLAPPSCTFIWLVRFPLLPLSLLSLTTRSA